MGLEAKNIFEGSFSDLSRKQSEARYAEAVSCLIKIDNCLTQLNAVLDCEIDYLLSMTESGIGNQNHEKLIALTEIESNLVHTAREAIADSPIG